MTDAAGSLSLAQYNAGVLLAASSTFQTLVGAADAAAALASIYHDDLPVPEDGQAYTAEELQDLRPFAIVSTPQTGQGMRWTRDGSGGWEIGGQLLVLIEQDVPSEIADDHAEIMLRFRNTIGQIVDDMRVLTNADGTYLQCDFELLEGPARIAEDETVNKGDHVWAVLLLQHGRGGG